MMKNIISALLPIPRFDQTLEDAPQPHARKVFALRNVHFRDIKALGFDMDYTLSHYRTPEIEELAYSTSVQLLVQERNYPAWLCETHFDPSYAIRGLVLDGAKGNLLKLDISRQVVRACHGTRPMSREQIDQAYGRRRVIASGPGFRSIDTLFEIPECHIYAVLVDGLDDGRIAGRDCLQLFQDVRWAIDTAHRNGKLKAAILANPELYILKDPELAPALDRWKRAGKKLFVLSNSEWSFTDGVLRFLLNGQDPARPNWIDYFDRVVVSARKPVFFQETPAPQGLPAETKAFMGGNALWLEDELQAFGEEVMYVGDHIYGDILRSKKNVSWHTMLLIPELALALEQLEEQAGELQNFVRFETVRRKSELQLSLLEDTLRRNQEHRRVLAPRLSREALQALDQEADQLKEAVEASQRRLEDEKRALAQLDDRLESAFNPTWGSIFRDGYQQTRFADQIQQYACAYTGRISNLYLVDPTTALYAPVPTLPHERI